MKYQEANVYGKADLGGNLKKAIADLLAGKLTVEGTLVEIPDEIVDYDVKVKYNTQEDGGSVTLKIGWDFPVVEEAAAEEEF